MQKVSSREIRYIRAALENDENLDPESWKHAAQRLLDALDELRDGLEFLRDWI